MAVDNLPYDVKIYLSSNKTAPIVLHSSETIDLNEHSYS